MTAMQYYFPILLFFEMPLCSFMSPSSCMLHNNRRYVFFVDSSLRAFISCSKNIISWAVLCQL